MRALKVHSEEDENTVKSLLEDKCSFLKKALENYILCLKAGVRRTVCCANTLLHCGRIWLVFSLPLCVCVCVCVWWSIRMSMT